MAARNKEPQAERLSQIKADIAAHPGKHDLSLAWLSARHGLRPRQIQNLFYAEGAGFSAFLLECRLAHAHALISDVANKSRPIIQIAAMSGFGDISWFNNAFRRRFGMTPSAARMAGAAEDMESLTEMKSGEGAAHSPPQA